MKIQWKKMIESSYINEKPKQHGYATQLFPIYGLLFHTHFIHSHTSFHSLFMYNPLMASNAPLLQAMPFLSFLLDSHSLPKSVADPSFLKGC